MIDPDLSIENLRPIIEEAFANVEPPDPENVIQHDCPECRAVRRVFRHEQWRSIKPNKVDWGHDKLSLFTPQAFQYFLPAFMLYSVGDPSSIVCNFWSTPFCKSKRKEMIGGRRDLINSRQVKRQLAVSSCVGFSFGQNVLPILKISSARWRNGGKSNLVELF